MSQPSDRPTIPKVSNEAVEFSLDYLDVPHQERNVENMIGFLTDRQPVVAKMLLAAAEELTNLPSRFGFELTEDEHGEIKFGFLFHYLLTWHALYKQLELDDAKKGE